MDKSQDYVVVEHWQKISRMARGYRVKKMGYKCVPVIANFTRMRSKKNSLV